MKYEFDFWAGYHAIEPEQPGEAEVPGNGSAVEPDNDLRSEVEALRKALENSRKIERQYKKLEAILGDTDPAKLMQLREADAKQQQQQQEMEQRILAAKNEAAKEYEQQLQQAAQERETLLKEQQQQALEYEIFQAFGAANGTASEFKGFMTLAESLFHRTDSGLQVKDASGKLITTKGEDGQIKAASPVEFMKLLVQGKLDSDYNIPSAKLLKWTFSNFNQARGAGLPTINGETPTKPYADMTKAELAQYAFKR